jgi:hypothetical protein
MAKKHHHDSTHIAIIAMVSLVAVIALILLFVSLAPLANVGLATKIKQQQELYQETSELKTYAEQYDDPLKTDLNTLADAMESKDESQLVEITKKLQTNPEFANNPGLLNALNKLQQAPNQHAVNVALKNLNDLLAAAPIQPAIFSSCRPKEISATSNFEKEGKCEPGEFRSFYSAFEEHDGDLEMLQLLGSPWLTEGDPWADHTFDTCAEAWTKLINSCAETCSQHLRCEFGGIQPYFDYDSQDEQSVPQTTCENTADDTHTHSCTMHAICNCVRP